MSVNIERIVNEDISSRVTQYDVLFEAITNSIHANATNIKCYLNSNDNLLKEDGKEIGAIRVDTIRIIDNGDGLTNENYNSFSNYRTEFKKALGCKGVGRFVFLKLYESVVYTSRIKSLQEERIVNFNFNFDTDNLHKIPSKVSENQTELSLSKISKQYYDISNEKKQDRRIELNLYSIRKAVLMNLIPTLYFYKQKLINITIDFIDEYNNIKLQILPSDIPNFIKKPFKVKNINGDNFEFTLNYIIDKTNDSLSAYYCANNRTVCEFRAQDFEITMPYGYSGFMLLESEYFNQKVNNERNNFDIYPVKTDIFNNLSWEMINSELKKIIGELVKEGIPETKKINSEKILQIQEERPYLIQYIEDGDIEMAGFLDKKSIIDKAKKKFDIAKERVLLNSGKDEYTDEELNEAIQLAQNELVSYINDRVMVIERLKNLVEKSERVESIIHNLFMQMQTNDDYYSVGKNNLWLLDDRFTTYSYAASDNRIREVLKGIDEENGDTQILDDRPDLSLFFSHNPQKPGRLKSVLVEIKPFDYASKPDRKKFAGIQQLIDYVKAFKEKEKIEEVSAYLITEVDSKLDERLTDNDFTKLFSLENPIYHRFYQGAGISIFVISASTLIKDAEARNKVFLDIIQRQNKLNRLIEQSKTA
ncbi:hypothetical protein BWK59_00810 [Flavobacterium davisii]|uniref:ATP-binding protein n=2 Tax=Flavobacterium davisii TaxID=2906077 RepID=A0A246GLM5_9FLAO|nr:hypothetical protein BWK59_00810 [Flavobacterium davisii]